MTQILHDRAQLADGFKGFAPTANLATTLDWTSTLTARLESNPIHVRRKLFRRVIRLGALKPGWLSIEIDGRR